MPSSELREQILAKQAENIPITLIAEQLGVSRQTIYKHLAASDNWESYFKAKSNTLNRLALDAVERACKRGDGRIGLAWLEHTVLAPTPSEHLHLHGDVSLVSAVGMVPSTTATTSTPSLPSSTVSTGTEAPAKPGQADMSLSPHTNFSAFSDEELEAELARRKAARSPVIDAEVLDAAR